MKIFLEHLRSKTIPHDVLEELFGLSVVFYDGMPVSTLSYVIC